MTARLYRMDETGVRPGRTFESMEDAITVMEAIHICGLTGYMIGNER